MSISAGQIRAARALLGWDQGELASRSAVGVASIRRLEGGVGKANPGTLRLIELAFDQAGVVFDLEAGAGLGVRFKESGP